MKKFGMLIVVLIFAGTQMVMAQQQTPPQPQQPQKLAPVREYIQKNVVPVIKQEQGKFIDALTPSEKQELTKIQEEFKDLRPGNMRPGTGMRGNYNPGMMQNHRADVQNLLDQVKKIADAHPKAATAYKNAIEAMKDKWANDIKSIRDKNAIGYGRGMNQNNRTPFILDRLSDPAFGLMFNGELFPMGMRPDMGSRMGPGTGRGMGYGNSGRRGTFNGPMARGMRCDYGRMGRNMQGRHLGMDHGFGPGCYGCNGMSGRYNMQGNYGEMMRAMNPEVKKDLLAYAEKNIFPVLNKERNAFDKELKNSEKRDIEVARKNILDIKTQMKKYWENKSVQPGQRMGDSTRLALRLELEKNMIMLREIVLNHYTQLHASLDNMKQYLPEWKTGMHHIVFQNTKDFDRPMGQGYGRMMRPNGRMMASHGKQRMMSPGVRFLLYDPAHPGEHFFPLNNGMPANGNMK